MSNNVDRWGEFEPGFRPVQSFDSPQTGAVVQTTNQGRFPQIFGNTNGQVVGGPAVKGQFVRSELDGDAGFVKCYYYQSNMVTCDRNLEYGEYGCCTTGCCPKDYLMMGGLYVLIAFVVVLLIVSIIMAIVCYTRSKSTQKKEDKMQAGGGYAYSNYGGSQVGYNGGGAGSVYGGGPPQMIGGPPSYQSPYAYQVGPPSTRY